ncbi:MAG TPA: ABC transporter permease, partial [Bryobacteraceae bacterium]
MGDDFRIALRRLMRAPWFSTAVIGTLAIAIGGSACVFSVVNGVLLRPLPYRASDALVAVINTGPRPADNISPRDVADLQEGLPGLTLAAYYKDPSLTLETETEPLRVAVTDVSANWFGLFGLPMKLGRPFAKGEDREGAAPVVVLSDRFWRSHYGADPGVLRQTLRLNDTSYRVIGVAPTRLAFPDVPDLWKPMVLDHRIADRGARFAYSVGRLAPGTSLARGRAELATAAGRIHDAYPEIETGLHYDLAPLQHFIVGSVGPVLFVLFGGVACLLLIACANVTSLFLVRATGRATEIGVRLALGARRPRIARELIVESLLLALAGGTIGALIAAWATHVLVAMDVGDLPRITDVVVDARVLAFTLGAICGAAALMGLLPALQLSGTDALSAVRAGSRAVTAEKRSGHLRRAFIVGELALALPLLIGAGLLARSLVRLLHVDPGFRPEHVVRFSVVDLDTV